VLRVLTANLLAGRAGAQAVVELAGRTHADVLFVQELTGEAASDLGLPAGLPVVAGPAEATALGNVLVQARALGAAPATLPGLRAILRSCLALRTFAPAGNARGWESAAARLV